MGTPCNTYIQIVQNEDICNGDVKNASCIIDSTLYIELGLTENATQKQINQALYNAFLNLKAKTDNLQQQIDNL